MTARAYLNPCAPSAGLQMQRAEFSFNRINEMLDCKLTTPHSYMDRDLNIHTDFRCAETETKDGRLVGVRVDQKRVFQIQNGQIGYTQCFTLKECAETIKRLMAD